MPQRRPCPRIGAKTSSLLSQVASPSGAPRRCAGGVRFRLLSKLVLLCSCANLPRLASSTMLSTQLGRHNHLGVGNCRCASDDAHVVVNRELSQCLTKAYEYQHRYPCFHGALYLRALTLTLTLIGALYLRAPNGSREKDRPCRIIDRSHPLCSL